MRRTTALLVGVMLMLLLATACGNQETVLSNQESQTAESTVEASMETEPEPLETNTEEPAVMESESVISNAGILVVYYSATGNTRAIAEHIANITGAATFELQPAEPYTEEDLDWTADDSRVNEEHEDESLRNVPLVETTPSDWDAYDTVFLGYPIWWGIAAWPVDGFVTGNDFSGKTVIPFCTSSTSGIGESGELLAEAAGSGNWLQGNRFSASATGEEVREWVDGLGLYQDEAS